MACAWTDRVVATIRSFTPTAKLSNNTKLSLEDMAHLQSLINQFDESSYTVSGDCGNSISDGSDPYVKFPQNMGKKNSRLATYLIMQITQGLIH